MIPDKSDSIWKRFVNSDKDYGFQCLASQMMYTRVKQMMKLEGAGTEEEAIDIAHGFFESNFNIAENDFKKIIG